VSEFLAFVKEVYRSVDYSYLELVEFKEFLRWTVFCCVLGAAILGFRRFRNKFKK
jgi:hypothetical protein